MINTSKTTHKSMQYIFGVVPDPNQLGYLDLFPDPDWNPGSLKD